MREEWRSVIGFSEYEVSNFGFVRGPNGLKSQHRSHGYPRVFFYRGTSSYGRFVHRLVARAFLGPARGRMVNHKDGNKGNPRLDNLEYLSAKGNSQHALAMGLMRFAKGSARPGAVLVESDIPKLFREVATGARRRDVATRYRICKSVLSAIIARDRWKHVYVPAGVVLRAQSQLHGNSGIKNGNAKLDDAAVVRIFRAAKCGDGLDKIAADFNVSRSLVSMVLVRKSHPHVPIPKSLIPRRTEAGRIASTR